MSDKKQYWYCLSYQDASAKACTYVGYSSKNEITMSEIRRNKKEAGVSDSAVLIACSYLGRMTREEFGGGS